VSGGGVSASKLAADRSRGASSRDRAQFGFEQGSEAYPWDRVPHHQPARCWSCCTSSMGTRPAGWKGPGDRQDDAQDQDDDQDLDLDVPPPSSGG